MKQFGRVIGSLIVVSAISFLGAYGCGDDDEGAGGAGASGGVGGVGGSAGAGGQALSDTLTVHVVENSASLPSLMGVTVAFDMPGGARVEGTTGADGLVTFEDFDWDAGQGAVTAYLEGYVLTSIVQLDEARIAERTDADGYYEIPLWPIAAEPETVAVSGTAIGLQDTAHRYEVSSVGDLGYLETGLWRGIGTATFTVTVTKGVPLNLQAFEYEDDATSLDWWDRTIIQTMYMDIGPLDADTTGVVLDFTTNQSTIHTADVSMVLPSRPESPLHGGEPYCVVCSQNSVWCHGWPTPVDFSPSGDQIDVSFLWHEPPIIESPYWFCTVTNGYQASTTWIQGNPQADAQDSLLDVPQWITPADPNTEHPLSEPFEFQFFDDDVPVTGVFLVDSGVEVWRVFGPANATSLTVPPLPSTVAAGTLFGPAARAIAIGAVLRDRNNPAKLTRSLPTAIAP